MHTNQQFKLRTFWEHNEPEIVTVTNITSDNWTQMITFKVVRDGSVGQLDVHTFRDLYVPYGVGVEDDDL